MAEWGHDRQLDWYLLQYDEHRGMRDLMRDLNSLYRQQPALHQRDDRADGFQWLIGDDNTNSVYAWLRRGEEGSMLLVVHNFTPVVRSGYRVGVPDASGWRVLLNSDAHEYSGSGAGSHGELGSEPRQSHGQPCSLLLELPPLGTLIVGVG